MAKHTVITNKGIEYNINKLKKADILTRIESDKGGYWEIKKKQKNSF